MVHAVGLGTAQLIEAAHGVQGRDLLLNGVGDAVLGQQLADRAVLAFGAGAVVAEDVDHDRVIPHPQALELIDHLPHLGIHMLHKAGVDLHQPQLERALGHRNAVPGGHGGGAGRQFGVGGNPAELLLARKHPLAVGIPAGVELALIFIRPLLGGGSGALDCWAPSFRS